MVGLLESITHKMLQDFAMPWSGLRKREGKGLLAKKYVQGDQMELLKNMKMSKQL